MSSTELTDGNTARVVAITPTTSIPMANRLNTKNCIDLDQAAKLFDLMVRNGLDARLTTGTFGECPSLTCDELPGFVAAVVESVAGRMPVFAGVVTTPNTRDAIARGRRPGTDALFGGSPLWI